MSANPFFQFYPSDWLAGTRGLSAAETGIYITLIAMMYEAEGPIPNDPKRLARLCGTTTAAFSKASESLVKAGKMTLSLDGFFNNRVGVEIEKRSEKRATSATSAKTRWRKTKEKQGDGDANAMRTQCGTDANQNPEPEVTASAVTARVPEKELLDALLDAVGEEKIQGHCVQDLSSIYGLLQAGVDLETDILPVIRAKAARLARPARSWGFFIDAIRDAYERRIKAGLGLPKPVAVATTPDAERDPEWLAKAWPLRLERGRNFGEWFDKYGPPPGEAGCRVPAELIRPGDGRGWGQERKAA